MPKIVVVGAAGRCGRGAISFARRLGLQVTEWHRKDTKGEILFRVVRCAACRSAALCLPSRMAWLAASGNRDTNGFPELCQHSILLNAIRLDGSSTHPFLTQDTIRQVTRTRVLFDLLDQMTELLYRHSLEGNSLSW